MDDARPPHLHLSALARLHALEWRYDGPLPADALTALTATPAELAARTGAADGALLDRMGRDAVQALARVRRDAGTGGLDRHPARTQMLRNRQAALRRRHGLAAPA